MFYICYDPVNRKKTILFQNDRKGRNLIDIYFLENESYNVRTVFDSHIENWKNWLFDIIERCDKQTRDNLMYNTFLVPFDLVTESEMFNQAICFAEAIPEIEEASYAM